MPQLRRDDALTTLQIFDDATYLREALSLPVNQSEDDVDAQLALLARESGIENPYRFLCPVQNISRALSTTTTGSAHSSSLSIYSHQTQSTGFTDRSRTSREQPYVRRLPPQQITPTLARASIAVDSPMEYFPSNFKQRHSTASTFSAERSMSSGASSLHKTSTRRKRASFLSMFRRDSSTCTSPSHHRHHGKHRGPKLECGHSLSTSAIRAHIKEALQAQTGAIPSCCNIPLPRATLEVVLTNEETDRVLEGAVKSPELSSLRDSGYSENGMSSIELPRAVQKMPLPTASKSMPNTPPRRISVHVPTGSLANEALKSFKAQQKEEMERVSAFESKQRKDLEAHQRCSLKQLASQHEDNKDKRKEQHILELEDLEDAQINVEDTLRKAQDLETQNVATALKHMEAYCLSSNSDPDFAHTVTQDDFKKLDRQRLIQQSLPRKHESAINVLRSRQDRAMKLKIQKQEAELAEMDAEFEKEKVAEELQHAQESERLNVVIDARRKRVQQRWDLKFEMWRKDWDSQHCSGTHFENVDWPLKTQYGGSICGIPESSETTTPIHAAA